MLIELGCDQFKENGVTRPMVIFNKSLNVVLGDSAGSNSIGKSSFLLAVDFALGGTSYVTRAPDIQKNVGPHTIRFAFQFGGQRHYFSRDTMNFMEVAVCDEHYIVQRKVPLDEFLAFLKEKYQITQESLTFRDALTRYSRIYQKGNLNEKDPLLAAEKEPAKKAVLSLLKLFDMFAGIEDARKASEAADEKYDVYRDGVRYSFIPTISSKRELKAKESRLQQLKAIQDNFVDPKALKNKTAEELEHISATKSELQRLRTQRSRTDSRLARLMVNLSEERFDFSEDFKELQELFPTVNIKRVEEVESFHLKLSTILKHELEEEKLKAEAELKRLDVAIGAAEEVLLGFDVPSGVSKRLLNEFAAAKAEEDQIKAAKKSYEEEQRLKHVRDEYREAYRTRLEGDVLSLQTQINERMKELNDYIYDGGKMPPIISLSTGSYNFETTNDTGTGTSFKSLAVFDLSVLGLTNLPTIIHDSIILKQIGDAPVEKLIALYRRAGKQVFIALDKADSYTKEASAMLYDGAVLHLSNHGHELFGWSWGDVGQAGTRHTMASGA